MSTEYVKTKRGLFDFDDLTENTEAPVLHKSKKKRKMAPFYIEAFDKLDRNLKVKAENTVAERTTTINDSIVHDKFTEDTQLSQPKQPSEGSYDSIWKKPSIRRNINFEEEICLDEECLFEDNDEELDCAVDTPPINIYSKYSIQPNTQPSSVPKKSQKEGIKPLFRNAENVELWDASFNLDEATKMHKKISALYCTKEGKITDSEA